MKKYYLTVLYLTSNVKIPHQYDYVVITADSFNTMAGSYRFYLKHELDPNKDVLLALYPVNCTIITKIEDNK